MKSIDALLKELTLEEKASLCSGKDFWTTKAVERLGIPSWTMTDGPHGVRLQRPGEDALSLTDAVPATCFPTGAGLASTWDRGLLEEVGRALGREAQASGVGVLLGPGANIKRSPLCGRNFEYFSEDPFLAGQMAKHHILGLQSQGVGASLKHFAANNQEKLRMTVDAVVDERTLREIYLPAFETAVTEAQPWTVMSSYNRLNGTFASENPWLLTQVLKQEWGHQGVVVTDWGAANDRAAGVAAGNELEMPGNGGLTDADIVAAVKKGTLSAATLDRTVRRLLELTQKVLDHLDPQASFDRNAHHALARRVAGDSFVLLKNDGVLPLKARTVAVIGTFAKSPRYQGGGSSHISPTRLDDAEDELRQAFAGTVTYAAGYPLKGDTPDVALVAEAQRVAAAADVAVVFLGLTDTYESEGYDRSHLGIPASHTAALEAVLNVQKNVVVVLSNGSPVDLPWVDRAGAVLETHLGGQAWGGAVADVLTGRVNPSGKLAETLPLRLKDTPAYLNFPGDARRVEYREGVFVGYRHYDALALATRFPFGHGLSYTSFAYGPLLLDRTDARDDQPVTVTLSVTNTGALPGAEVVQLYVGARAPSVIRPLRELREFAKVVLAPGETKTVTFTLGPRAFAFWSTDENRWVVDAGEYELCAGSSSRDLRQKAVVTMRPTRPLQRHYDQNTTLGSLANHPLASGFVKLVLSTMTKAFGTYEPGSPEARMMESMVLEMPLRNLVRMSGGRLPPVAITVLIGVLNGVEPLSALDRFIPR